MKIVRIKHVAGAMLVSLTMTAAGPAAAQVFKSVNYSEHRAPVKVTAPGGEVTLSARADGEGMIKARAAIRIAGYPATIVTEEESASIAFDRWVGIGKLAATDAAPSVLLQGYTGGAHCCATLLVVTPWNGALKTLTFESIDGEGMAAFPKDIDGDGAVDFERQDDRFRYRFASGAGSYSPPVLYNVRGGALVDVSSEQRFAGFWEDYARKSRALCADASDSERNAACAVYVVAGVHLGRFEDTLRDADALANHGLDAQMPEGCKVGSDDYDCPEGQELKFADFQTALRWLLKQGKYID